MKHGVGPCKIFPKISPNIAKHGGKISAKILPNIAKHGPGALQNFPYIIAKHCKTWPGALQNCVKIIAKLLFMNVVNLLMKMIEIFCENLDFAKLFAKMLLF